MAAEISRSLDRLLHFSHAFLHFGSELSDERETVPGP